MRYITKEFVFSSFFPYFYLRSRRAFSTLLVAVSFLITASAKGQAPSFFMFEMNEFDISHVGFNTEASDFGPSFVGDELWFSAYSEKDAKKAVRGKTKNIYYSIFRTPIDTRGYTLYEPRVALKDINSGLHEGPVAYCEKTKELFVTLSNTVNVDVVENGKTLIKERIRLSIVSFVNENGRWAKKEEMPFNDKIYSVGHPTLTPSGDTLFFTSDIPELSCGGTDIFMVVRQNGQWGMPVSLSKNINTKGNEMFPFYHQSGMLIFASDSLGNTGGLDLFCCDLQPEGFGKALPLQMFNSPYDDFGLIIHPSGESGYFVSDRPGQNGSDDIYLVKIKNTFAQVKGNVYDDLENIPVSGAEVTLYNCNGDKIASQVSNHDGRFVFKVLRGGCYVAEVSAKDYASNRVAFGNSDNVSVPLTHDRTLELVIVDYDSGKAISDVRLQVDSQPTVMVHEDGVYSKKLSTEKVMNLYLTAPGYLNQPLEINTTLEYFTRDTVRLKKIEVGQSYLLDGIGFEPETSVLLESSRMALDRFVRLLHENPAIKAEIGSYTHTSSSEKGNLKLSQQRAEALVSYIRDNGIRKERVVGKGYGKSKPRIPCEPCTVDEIYINERIEFKIAAFVR